MKIELTVAIISGVFALGSAVLAYKAQSDVAKLQLKVAQALEERKPYLEERKNGYAQFFGGVAKGWQSDDWTKRSDKARRKGDEKEARRLSAKAEKFGEDADELFTNGRFRIGVFSDADVVHATAKYFLTHRIKKLCDNSTKFRDDVTIYQAMRREMNAPGKVEDKDLIAVLFQCKLNE